MGLKIIYYCIYLIIHYRINTERNLSYKCILKPRIFFIFLCRISTLLFSLMNAPFYENIYLPSIWKIIEPNRNKVALTGRKSQIIGSIDVHSSFYLYYFSAELLYFIPRKNMELWRNFQHFEEKIIKKKFSEELI